MDIAVIGADPWFVEALRGLLREDDRFRLGLVAPEIGAFTADPCARIVGLAILAQENGSGEAERLIAWSRRVHPSLRVVVKLPVLRPDLVRNAIQAGARGCFSAEDPPSVLLTLLTSVAAGRINFPFVDFAELRQDPFEQLTRREIEVLGALAKGWSNQQISARLGISANTVKYHLKLIYDKLGVASRSAAVAQYLSRYPA